MSAQGLARRSLSSAAWNLGANLLAVAVLFVRSVVLARWLPVETFGTYAFASAVAMVSVGGTDLGFGGAFVHRTPETENEEKAAAVHFSLRALLILAWGLLLVVFALAFTEGETRTALLVLAGTTSGLQLASTPRLVLVRRVEHARLAVLRVLVVVLGSLTAIGLAFGGATLWALLSVDLLTAGLTIAVLYLWRPVWRPRFAWTAEIRRYYWRYGRTVFAASLIDRVLERLGDLWTALLLGHTPLGFLSRASTFAGYPRRMLAIPVNQVAAGTYAELKEDRLRLSQAFFRVNYVLLRAGVLAAGLLALLAPELIPALIGERWLPMLPAFRLLLVFCAVDPIRSTVAGLFPAVGYPELLLRVRVIQLVTLVAGLALLARPWGIVGVAAALSCTSLVGTGLLLWWVRRLVDYSPFTLFVPALVALGVGLTASFWFQPIIQSGFAAITSLLVQAALFGVVYGAVLVLLEWRRAQQIWRWAWQLLRS